MRKLIVNVCKYIIEKLETSDTVDGIKRRESHGRTYPTGIKRGAYHRGCWIIHNTNQHFYRTQEDAAKAASQLFNTEIRRSDISNALTKKDGELIVGGKTLCLIAYEL